MTIEVLLVDDDVADQELVKRALDREEFAVNLSTVSGGQQALDYLHNCQRSSESTNSAMPDLILLDLNMPKVNGREVLKQIRANPALSQLAVVVLTTSDQERDVLESYRLGCQSYITKPSSVAQLIEILKEVGSYWFKLVTLPPKPA